MAIISFSRRFIFIKTTKTAGTSIEVHLGRVCGPDDIVTPIYSDNKAHQPRNYGDAYYNHMPAALILSLQPEAFRHLFKFCFERHPVDKCISHYAMLKNSPLHMHPSNPKSWEAYVDQGVFPIDHEKYCSDNETVLVDKIYRYENLEESVRDIERRLDVSVGPITVREKADFRKGKAGIPTFYDVMHNPEQKRRIMTAFAVSLSFTPYE